MVNELDLVVLNHDINESRLKAGDVGTVVHSYADGKGYEVEFLTAEGKTIALLTLTTNDIRPIHHAEILHVREITPAFA
jgi:hypothetical protein